MLKSFNLATSGVGTRTNSYTYFGSGLFTGLLQTSTDGRGVVCTHSYDIFLRPETNSYSGSLAEHNSISVQKYDPRGLVTNITDSFASANTGPATAIRRSYDSYGLLSGESVSVNGNIHFGVNQSRDSAGRRSSVGFGTFGYGFGWRADGQLASVGNGTYAYTTAGLLTSRNVGGSSVNVASRDGMGRTLSRTTAINSITRLSETMAWTGDGLLSGHTLVRTDYTDSRSYEYADFSRRLAIERLNLTNGIAWTNVFGYDAGVSGGAGVLTRIAEPQSGGAEWTASMDLFNRVDKGNQ